MSRPLQPLRRTVFMVDNPDATEELSSEQLLKAAEAASEPLPVKQEEEIDDGFDPRLILYVSFPALVLVAQLFFTFSRDYISGDAAGPAVMDLWIP